MSRIVTRIAPCLFVLALVLAPGGGSLAATRAHSVEVGAFIPYTIFDHDWEIDNSAGYGVRVGWNFAKGGEVEVSYAVMSTSMSDASGIDADVDVTSLNVALIHNWKAGSKLVPFFYGGASYVTPTAEGSDLPPPSEFNFRNERGELGFNLGGGVRYYLGDRLNVRAEAHGVLVTPDSQMNLEVLVGMGWIFGGK
jgi:hypothetical protein